MVYKALGGYVLREQTQFLFGTVYSLENEIVRNYVKSRVKFVQEFTKMNNIEALVIYHSFEGILSVSFDSKQLGPHQEPKLVELDVTAPYGAVSPGQRLIDLNFPYVNLLTTYRFGGLIHDVARRFCYDYKLLTAAPDRPQTHAVKKFNVKHYRVNHEMLAICITSAKGSLMVGPTKSWVNRDENNHAFHYLIRLRRETGIQFADMMMIAAYAENRKALITMRNQLAQDPDNTGIGDFRILIVDASQRDQALVVIAVISNNRASGFLADSRRLTVLMTRGKAAFVLSFPERQGNAPLGSGSNKERQFRAITNYLEEIGAYRTVNGDDYPELVGKAVFYRHLDHHQAHRGKRKAPDNGTASSSDRFDVGFKNEGVIGVWAGGDESGATTDPPAGETTIPAPDETTILFVDETIDPLAGENVRFSRGEIVIPRAGKLFFDPASEATYTPTGEATGGAVGSGTDVDGKDSSNQEDGGEVEFDF